MIDIEKIGFHPRRPEGRRGARRDVEWEKLLAAGFGGCLGVAIPLCRPPGAETRRGLAGIAKFGLMYMARTGCQWRFLPNDFPDWRAVAKTYYRWVDRGVWQTVNDALRRKLRIAAGREAEPSAAIIDSQSVKTTEKGGPVDSMPGRK